MNPSLFNYLITHSPICFFTFDQPRQWRKTLSSAVNCYRKIIKMKEELETEALNLNELEKLASNCPRCFGPQLPEHRLNQTATQRKNEPDYIVCFDGNFQHGRHQAASTEHEGIAISYPTIFLDPEEVDRWKAPQQGNILSDELVQF